MKKRSKKTYEDGTFIDPPPPLKLTIPRNQGCLKRYRNQCQCCCNCGFHQQINGHPWITNTSIMKNTGIYVCSMLENLVISQKHGICEAWKPKKNETARN
jgi:hypothetical protein